MTKLVLSSGTPLYRDPYRKVGLAQPGHSRSVLLDDPVDAVGEIGKNALTWLAVEVLARVAGELSLAYAGPQLESAVRVGAPDGDQLHRALVDATGRAAQLSNATVRAQAVATLNNLAARLVGKRNELPRVVLSELEDGSALVEWLLDGRRLGFALYPDKASSGWFFVSGAESGNIMASGAWIDAPMEQLVAWALGTQT
ncbi:MAG TPA: hypothetical protein VGL81_24475 [Polyangiaceae bacterium]